MALVLKNRHLKLEILPPGRVYLGSRFDWTGLVAQVTLDNRHTFCTRESVEPALSKKLGRGLANEFGITRAIGYNDCPVGGMFPKIGVGLLLKNPEDHYDFFKKYEIKSFSFSLERDRESLAVTCLGQEVRGYAFKLVKTISLKDNGFKIAYALSNTGNKQIATDEYVHNFLAIDKGGIGQNYALKFPFTLDPAAFTAFVDPESLLSIAGGTVTWKTAPQKEFYIGRVNPQPLSGEAWCLTHKIFRVGIREICEFSVHQINLWGKGHVVSPEAFYDIDLAPGKTARWQRVYEVFEF